MPRFEYKHDSALFIYMSRMEGNDIQGCAVCSSESNNWCENCKKVTYCCANHEQKDKRRHKYYCFPAIIQADEVKGRFMVATRDIRQAEVIFIEEPLITGPNPNVSEADFPLCLGCYKHVKSNYKCSHCKWPMCDFACEQLPQHAEWECHVFFTQKMSPVKKPMQYYFVNILRCFMMEKFEPGIWGKVLSLEHHEQFRRKSEVSMRFRRTTFSCFGKLFGEETISQPAFQRMISKILGAFEINALMFSDKEKYAGFSRDCMFLMDKISFLSHDCFPNATWLRREDKILKGTFSVHLFATVPIKKGEVISITYTHSLDSTFARMCYLRSVYFFDCKCKRCIDPTELGTYLSGVKCQNKKCSNGYLLPIATNMIDYECDKCGRRTDIINMEFQTESYIEYEYLMFMDPSAKNLKKLEKFIQNRTDKPLHPNHHILLDAKKDMIKMMGKIQNCTEEFLTKQINLARSILEILDVICPGLNYHRGVVLYRLFKAKLRLLETIHPINPCADSPKSEELNSKEEELYYELLKIATEAIDILSWTSDGSHSYKLATKLVVKLQYLKDNFGIFYGEIFKTCMVNNNAYDLISEIISISDETSESYRTENQSATQDVEHEFNSCENDVELSIFDATSAIVFLLFILVVILYFEKFYSYMTS